MKICDYVNIGRCASVKVGPLITSFPLLSGDLLIFFNCYIKDMGKACILVKCSKAKFILQSGKSLQYYRT